MSAPRDELHQKGINLNYILSDTSNGVNLIFSLETVNLSQLIGFLSTLINFCFS